MELVVTVPDRALTGPIEVTVGGVSVQSADFTVLPPDELAITGITPDRAPEGATVTITGQNFGATPAANTVTFLGVHPDPDPANSDNVEADVTSATTMELVVTVPDRALTGTIEVTVGDVSVQVCGLYRPAPGRVGHHRHKP